MDICKDRVHFTGGTKNENGAGVNLNLTNEYQLVCLYICGIHGSTILFHPCSNAFCAIKIITRDDSLNY